MTAFVLFVFWNLRVLKAWEESDISRVNSSGLSSRGRR